ncbi:hypothetical protein HW509_13810 [Asaia spathodeae]|uniref:hypothetical protein n=1 Tax=Asaia spathodeae TaxID=657016 RepID=UPI002FC32158
MKAACRVGALVATLSAFWMQDALAQSTPDCIDGAVSIPLLGGKGDSPILPATLDGKEIALYFSSGFDVLYVGDMEGFDTDDTRRTHVIMTNREHSQSRPVIKAGTLTLGGLDLQTPDMIQLIDYPMQHIGTRPLIGTIGSTFFNRLALLLDMPHGVFGLIRFRQEAACSNAQAGFIGTGAQALPLTGNDTIMGLIEGKERELSLDSDVPVTTLPERWLNRPAPGDSADDAQHPTVALFGDLHSRLHGTTLGTFRIGQESLDNMPVFAQRDLGVGLLGVDFFQSHIVLFDYPNHRVFLLPAHSQVTRPGLNLHFDRFREGQTSVKEKR